MMSSILRSTTRITTIRLSAVLRSQKLKPWEESQDKALIVEPVSRRHSKVATMGHSLGQCINLPAGWKTFVERDGPWYCKG